MADFSKATVAACVQGVDFTTRQMALLFIIGRTKAPKRFRDAAADLNISKPATTRAADRLMAAGLVERIPVKTDARQVDMALSVKGRAFLARALAGFPAELSPPVRKAA